MSLMVVVSTPITIAWTFVDDFGALVTGKDNADFGKSAYLTSAPSTTETPTVAAIPGQTGDYGITVTLTSVGLWRIAASCHHSDGETYRFGWDVQVITAAQADPVTAVGLTSARVAKLDRIGDIDVTVVSPTTESSNLTIYQGATYDSDESRALVFSITGASDLTGATVTLLFSWGVDSLSVTGATSNEGAATQTVTVELTATQTASLPSSGVSYSLTAVLANTHVEPLQTGRVIVIPSLPAN